MSIHTRRCLCQPVSKIVDIVDTVPAVQSIPWCYRVASLTGNVIIAQKAVIVDHFSQSVLRRVHFFIVQYSSCLRCTRKHSTITAHAPFFLSHGRILYYRHKTSTGCAEWSYSRCNIFSEIWPTVERLHSKFQPDTTFVTYIKLFRSNCSDDKSLL